MATQTSPPLVSVIVCVRNRPDQIRDCVKSLLASTHGSFEVIVVDDASTDATPGVVLEIAAADPADRLRLVRNATNLGVSGARNVGIRAARGELILFTDSDCVVRQDWIERMADALVDHNASAVCGMVEDPAPRNLAELAFFGNLTLRPGRLQNRKLAGCNMGFRRDVICDYLFDEQLTYGCDEDDVAKRLEAAGHQFAFAPAAVVLHRHPMTFKDYMRQARRQGVGSARYWFKHGQYVGRDILFNVLALLTLPLMLLGLPWALVPACLALLQLAAVWANERIFKGLSLAGSLRVLPVALSYNLVKTYSVLQTLMRIATGREPAAWLARRQCRA